MFVNEPARTAPYPRGHDQWDKAIDCEKTKEGEAIDDGTHIFGMSHFLKMEGVFE